MNKNKCFIFCLLVAMFLISCGKSVQQRVTEQLELGYRYLEEEKYEEAVVAFEDLGGNLAETLVALLYPENPSFSESDDGMMYVIGDYDMEIVASGNNDGHMVWMYRPVEGFRIYGIEPGMTESDAEGELERQGILPEGGYYMIPEEEAEGSDGYKYLTLVIEDGIVSQVRFAHYLGVGR